jgi:hypothetical protein
MLPCLPRVCEGRFLVKIGGHCQKCAKQKGVHMRIKVTYNNGIEWVSDTIRPEAIGEVKRDLETNPNVESWEVVKN